MRASRIMSAALVTTAVVGLPASGARAGGFGTIDVSPKAARPGDTVTLSTAHCGPGVPSAQGDSAAGGEFTLRPGTRPEILVGRFTVPDDTRPGTYGIGVRCPNGKEATGDLVVTGRAAATNRGAAHPAHPPASPTAAASGQPTSPPRAAQSGVGGSQGGMSVTEASLGAGVLTTAAAGGICVARRRGRRGKA